MGIIEDAIKDKKQIVFGYTNMWEEKGKHRVLPISTDKNKKGEYLVVTVYLGGNVKRKARRIRESYVKTEGPITPKFKINKMENVRYATFWDKIYIR